MSNTDRIEKQITLKAPRSRVWRAITDSKEFGTWFRVKMETPFVAGKMAHGQITYPGYEHLKMELFVERMEPEHLFALRWHPNATDPKHDYSNEPTTLIEFTLEEVPEGTRLTLVESGFDKLPADRRAEAFRSNDGGWTEQMKNIEGYLAK
jgi:uncharacterized protein YndB with AHSA1/START domain